MQTVIKGAMPPLYLGNTRLHEGFPGREIVELNKRERATLRRAAEILEELRRRIDPERTEEWTHDYMLAACAESWVSEAAEAESFDVVKPPPPLPWEPGA